MHLKIRNPEGDCRLMVCAGIANVTFALQYLVAISAHFGASGEIQCTQDFHSALGGRNSEAFYFLPSRLDDSGLEIII